MKVKKILKAVIVLLATGSIQLVNAQDIKYVSYDSIQNKNAVLSELSTLAHTITDTTITRCESRINSSKNDKENADLKVACQVQGLKALSHFSICAVYNNTQSLSNEKTISCFNSILNKY